MEGSISQGVLELGARFGGKLCDLCDPVAGVWVYDHTVEIRFETNEVWCHVCGVRARLNSHNVETVALLVVRKKGRRL